MAQHLRLGAGSSPDSHLVGSVTHMAVFWGGQESTGEGGEGLESGGSHVALYQVTGDHVGGAQLLLEPLGVLPVRPEP